jgi:UbiD family decarboxylase
MALQVDTQKLREMKTTAQDFCGTVENLVFNDNVGCTIHRLLLVGVDIDVYDFGDLIWAFSTRCRPGLDEYPFEDVSSFPLIPYMSHGAGAKDEGGKVVSNCLLPVEYMTGKNWETASFQESYAKELQEKVMNRWESLGFG